MSVSGLIIFLPVLFFLNAVKRTYPSLYADVSGKEDQRVSFLEIIVRGILVLSADLLTSQWIPLYFYGTKNLHEMDDFLVKKALVSTLLAALVMSPIDSYIIKLFR